MSDEEPTHHYITAVARGGPIDGGGVQFAMPAVDYSAGEPRNVVRGASFLVVIDETQHEYTLQLTNTHPFQEFVYRGPTLQLPADIVDR